MAKIPRIFRDNPPSGKVDLSIGQAATPYLVRDGEALLIFGSVDQASLQPSLAREAVYPIATSAGRAAAGFILADFREASMGPHSELQFFVLVGDEPNQAIGTSEYALAIAMATKPDWGTMCMHLWNDAESVLAYNNEYLGLNAELASFELLPETDQEALGFKVTGQCGATIITGRVGRSRSTSFAAMFRMTQLAGLRRFFELGIAPYARGNVVNRVSSVMPTNRKAEIFTDSDRNVIRPWSDRTDSIRVSHAEIGQLDFQPVSVQHLEPFRFVYRHPDDRLKLAQEMS